MTSTRIEREQLQLQSMRDWENERTARVDAYAAVLTHLNAARDALPRGDESYGKQVRELSYSVQAARGRLSAVLQETNPFVRS
jgi:hypothetical protein